MGGDRVTPPSVTSGEQPSEDQDFSRGSSVADPFFHPRDDIASRGKLESGIVNGEYESVLGGFEEVSCLISRGSLEHEANRRRRRNVHREVLQIYDQLRSRGRSLMEAKSKILSYTPGQWIEKVGGIKLSDYDVPKTTTLLLIGPKGSGKSSLVNRIFKVLEDDIFAPERAQVSYNSPVGDGSCFLQEYMIPRGSTSFCLYDTRGLSDDTSNNTEILKHWITRGVRHGEPIFRSSDSSSFRTRIKCKARENCFLAKEGRMVNFVIFVVDGVEVLRSMDADNDGGNVKVKQYTRMITTAFNCPYLSFKDDKPVVVVTHGDLLSLDDRAHIRFYLGELLGIPPAKQIFDIPESCDPVTELTILDMLRYCLEHADKNLPHKNQLAEKVRRVSFPACAFLLALFAFALGIMWGVRHPKTFRATPWKAKHEVEWRAIRHLWLDL